eukprot:Platyproteum_vivax@DN16732_c0_g1_i1.p1
MYMNIMASKNVAIWRFSWLVSPSLFEEVYICKLQRVFRILRCGFKLFTFSLLCKCIELQLLFVITIARPFVQQSVYDQYFLEAVVYELLLKIVMQHKTTS